MFYSYEMSNDIGNEYDRLSTDTIYSVFKLFFMFLWHLLLLKLHTWYAYFTEFLNSNLNHEKHIEI